MSSDSLWTQVWTPIVAIDDPRKKFEEQYLEEPEKSPLALTLFVAKLAIPHAAIPLEIFNKLWDRSQRASIEERARVMWELLCREIDRLETTKANIDDLAEAVQFILRRDAEQFNDRKRARYIRVFGNAARSDTHIENVMSMVQAIEQLNEQDVIVLKILNKIMNKASDWRSPTSSTDTWKLAPTVLIDRAPELAIQIAMALGQAVEKNTYSREVGYTICGRLQGFGLAHEIELQARELPLTNYCFRLSMDGIKLLKLLGEDVPNFERYFPSE